MRTPSQELATRVASDTGITGDVVENDPIEQGLDPLQEQLQTAVGEQFGGARTDPAGGHEEQVFHGPALQGGELVAFAQQVFGQSGRLGRSEVAVHAGVAQIGIDQRGRGARAAAP